MAHDRPVPMSVGIIVCSVCTVVRIHEVFVTTLDRWYVRCHVSVKAPFQFLTAYTATQCRNGRLKILFSALSELLAVTGRGDLQFVAVLGDGASRNADTLTVEDVGDLLVRQWLQGVLFPDEPRHPVLHRLG